MNIEKDKVVTINYTLKGDDGNIIDSSENGSPLQYIHGNGYLLPKLEDELLGKKPGDSFNVVLEAKDGYGEYNEDLVVDVPRDSFDTTVEIETGMQFQAETEEGPQIVTVKKISDDTITIDGNHELAGKRLHFAIEVLDVRNASEEELSGAEALVLLVAVSAIVVVEAVLDAHRV